MGKFIVTGGCGFIGSHLVDQLILEGQEVIVLDQLSSGEKKNLNSRAKFIDGDIRDLDLVRKLFATNPHGVFHLAAVASVEKSNQEWLNTHVVNDCGTVLLFEQAKEKKIPVIYASSAAVYGTSTKLPLREDSEINPLSAYGVDKYSNELHGKVASSIHGVPNIGFRFFNVFGPRQDPRSPYSGVISIFIRQLLERAPFTINGTGQQMRDFIYVKDVVRALIAGMKAKLKTPQGAHVYNVCTGIGTSLLQLAECLENITGTKVGRMYRSSRVGDIQKSLGSPELLHKELGIRAETPLKEGLKETLLAIRDEKKRKVSRAV